MPDPTLAELLGFAVIYICIGWLAACGWHESDWNVRERNARLAHEQAEQMHAAALARLRACPAPEQYDRDRRQS